MVSRPWLCTVVFLLLAGCTGAPTAMPEPTAPPPSAAVTSRPTTTSSTTTSTTSTLPTTTTTTVTLPDLDAEVSEPSGEGPHPAVVLVHGGSWVAGSPASLRALADHLVANGYLVVNTRYRLATLRSPGFPQALHDVACAVRYAALHPQSDGSVALVGHSAGAHLAAVVALTGDTYGDGCPVEAPAKADRLVGLAGPYDITRVGLLAAPFFGVTLTDDPDVWALGNPLDLVDSAGDMSVLVVHGQADAIVGLEFAEGFAQALEEAGIPVRIETATAATHMDVADPEFVGETVLEWLHSG